MVSNSKRNIIIERILFCGLLLNISIVGFLFEIYKYTFVGYSFVIILCSYLIGSYFVYKLLLKYFIRKRSQ